MTDGISFDVGGALPYIEDKIRALFGRDPRHVAAQQALERHLRITAKDASLVQIPGMDRPIPISEIYQPTRLVQKRGETRTTLRELIDRESDAIVFGGPGTGKTTLLRFWFTTLLRERDLLPLLFTLRWPGAAADLLTFIQGFDDRSLSRRAARIVLLVDGFDEIDDEDRRAVESALRNYASQHIGVFYVTCRSFYSVNDVVAPHWSIASFTAVDARNFVQSFGRAYGSDLDGHQIVAELRTRGLEEFLQHPLMLALVCILKSGAIPTLPRTTIALLRRAVDTLTFRWDEAKNVARRSRYELDGDDRVRCLMRIAFAMRNTVEPGSVVFAAADDYLRLLQRSDVSTDRLLEELAQWYGLLIPADDGQWSFSHRTVHDFLAARYWVENARFEPEKVTAWTTRAAYAACLTADATRSIVLALEHCADINVFTECLFNRAPFDVTNVAKAVVHHFSNQPESGFIQVTPEMVLIRTAKDFWSLCSQELVYAVLYATSPQQTMDRLLRWCSAVELALRGSTLPGRIVNELTSEVRTVAARVDVTMGDRRFDGFVSDLVRASVSSG